LILPHGARSGDNTAPPSCAIGRTGPRQSTYSL
jgi:hypothetical protein